MSRAFLASPDTADTFRAQNCRAEASRTPAAEAWGASAHQSDQSDQWDQWDQPAEASNLRESVLDDGDQLLPAVGGEVQQLGAAAGAGLQPRQDAVGEVQRVGDPHQAEPRAGQEGPLEEGVEDVLGLAVQLVHLIQDEQTGGGTERSSDVASASAGTPPPGGGGTHTAGPGPDRNLCRPFGPPGAFSLSASSGKMA